MGLGEAFGSDVSGLMLRKVSLSEEDLRVNDLIRKRSLKNNSVNSSERTWSQKEPGSSSGHLRAQ